MKEKEIWTIKTDDEIYDPKFGIVYRELVKGNTFEIILASADINYATDADLIIPPNHSELKYSILGHADILFPAMTDAEFFKNQIGSLSDDALYQIKKLRNETSKEVDITFKIGEPIVFKSDTRYSFGLKNLRIANKLGNEVFELSLSNIPDNIVPILIIETSDSSDLISDLEKLEDIQLKEEISKIMLSLRDQNISNDTIFYQNKTSEITEINIDLAELEKNYSLQGAVAA